MPPAPAPSATTTVAGVVQKGPLLTGSSISVQTLDANLNPTGTTFGTQTTNDSGDFSTANVPQDSFIQVTATGFYFDEVLNNNSFAQITLRSLAQTSGASASKANTNVLTAIALPRIQHLVTGGTTFAAAKSQAESEVVAAFGLPAITSGFETLNYSTSSGDNATLLAASALSQQVAVNSANNSSEVDSALSVFVAQFGADLAGNGLLGSAELRNQIGDAINTIDPAGVVSNLTSRYQSLGALSTVPDFSALIHRTVPVPHSFVTSKAASFPEVGGVFPAIAITPDGTPHIFFNNYNAVVHAWLAGGSWQIEAVFAAADYNGTGLSAASDHQGGLYVSWQGMYSARAAGATTWTTTTLDTYPFVVGSSVAASGSGSVAVAYFGGLGLAVATIASDGTVVTQIVASPESPPIDSMSSQATCLAFDSKSVPHVFWNVRNTVAPGLRHATLVNGQWVVTALVTTPAYGGCSVAVDANDAFYVSYLDNSVPGSRVARLATLTGAAWADVTQVPSITQTTAAVALAPGTGAVVTDTDAATGINFYTRLNTFTATRPVSAPSGGYLDAKFDPITSKVHIAWAATSGGVWYAVSN